jgi:hypothetical protein
LGLERDSIGGVLRSIDHLSWWEAGDRGAWTHA